jgi:hypothetical protein
MYIKKKKIYFCETKLNNDTENTDDFLFLLSLQVFYPFISFMDNVNDGGYFFMQNQIYNLIGLNTSLSF